MVLFKVSFCQIGSYRFSHHYNFIDFETHHLFLLCDTSLFLATLFTNCQVEVYSLKLFFVCLLLFYFIVLAIFVCKNE